VGTTSKQQKQEEVIESVEEKYGDYFYALLDGMHNALVHLKFYDLMQKSRSDYQSELNEVRTFWDFTIDAHRDAAILCLSKMLEERKSRDDSVTVWKFLGFIENNLALFDRKLCLKRCRSKYGYDDIARENHKKLTLADINSDRRNLEEYRKVINNVLGWRDKKVAHNDKRFSFGNMRVSEKYPISFEQLTDITEQLKKIFNRYSLAYDSTEYAFNVPGDYGVQLILEAIRVRREK
jgi:hypothetical protein